MAARGAVARREIAASVLIPADERWNPLEHVTAPEYVPPTWDGVHVGVRLVEAFKTLSKMPTPFFPSLGSMPFLWGPTTWPPVCVPLTAIRPAPRPRPKP